MFPCNGDEYEGEATSYNGGARFVVYGGFAPVEGDVAADCGSSFETDPHFLDTESSLGCAFSEGFADYFAASVRPDLSPYHYRSYMEADDAFPGCTERQSEEPYSCIGETSSEGSLIEGAYAAFLYDLTDSANESHDLIAAPGSYVRDLIRSCNVQYSGGGWRRANGTDEMVYCAENAINPGSYLTVRGAVPTGISEAATESGGWTASRVNANWHWNLYEKN